MKINNKRLFIYVVGRIKIRHGYVFKKPNIYNEMKQMLIWSSNTDLIEVNINEKKTSSEHEAKINKC